MIHEQGCFITSNTLTKYCRVCEAIRSTHATALDAAREAVEKQKYIPLENTGQFIITRNTKLWDDRKSWDKHGWWQFRTSALAAIDALREKQ